MKNQLIYIGIYDNEVRITLGDNKDALKIYADADFVIKINPKKTTIDDIVKILSQNLS